MAGAELMSSNGEQVANGVVDREEPLRLCYRFERRMWRSRRRVGWCETSARLLA